MSPAPVDFADVQGLVRFGYKHLVHARYDLVRVRDSGAARAWLKSARISDAVERTSSPASAMQVAFTAAGLRALGVSERLIAGFSHEFRGGMAEESRARQLGDVGANAPAHWEWGSADREPHLVVMFFAAPGRIDALVDGATGPAWHAAFSLVRHLDTSNLDGVEPFGFADGLSQPRLEWDLARATPCEQLDYTDVTALGEFVLGYRNEYGKFTERPLLKPDTASADLLAAEDAPTLRDLGRNGTYVVMRQLSQDVRGFWQFLVRVAGGNFREAERLAALMVGRTRAGDPVVLCDPAAPDPNAAPGALSQTPFTFNGDPAGRRCPLGAHVRRANPRTSDLPGRPSGLAKLMTRLGFGPCGFRDDLLSSVRFHRILRRGREYGPALAPQDALAPAPPDEPERGLQFICLNANLSRQFEFVQNAWIANAKFAGLDGENDPLLGNRRSIDERTLVDGFSLPSGHGARRKITGLPPFVQVRGGAYFFMPGLRALRYIAAAGDAADGVGAVR